MVLSDEEIKARCSDDCANPMIRPFTDHQVKTEDGKRIVSYGLSSYGYDIRCGSEFKIFHNAHCSLVDPKEFDPRNFVDLVQEDEPILIPPNSFALCRSFEYIKVPRDVLVICIGKSTYARCGVIANVTPLEPEWEGHITIELSNTTPNPAMIYPFEGVCQLVFHKGSQVCSTSYKDRQGKYMGQQGVTLPSV